MINDPLAHLKALRSGQNTASAGADPLARLKALRPQTRAPGAAVARKPGQPPIGQGYVQPAHGNLFDWLDYQRAAVAEKRFHQHSSDANMAANREAAFGPGFNANVYDKKLANNPVFQPGGALAPSGAPMSGAPKAVAGLIDLIAHGAIDLPIQAAEDPLSYESLLAGPLLKMGIGVAKPILGAAGHVLGPAVKPVARVAAPFVHSAMATGAGRAITGAAGETAYHAREIARQSREWWQAMTSYAPKTREQYGNTIAREAIGNESMQAAEGAQLERRLRDLAPGVHDPAKVPDSELLPVALVLNGQMKLSQLSPTQRALYTSMRGLTNAIVMLKAKVGGGAIAKISRAFQRGDTAVPKRVIEKPAPAAAAASAPGGSASDPLTKLRQEISDMAASFREEQPAGRKIVGAKKTGPLELRGYVKPNAPQLPESLREFMPQEGWITGRQVRTPYAPSLHHAAEVSGDTAAQTINRLAFEDPHELPRTDIAITADNLPQFRDAWEGMIRSGARSIAAHRSVERLKAIFGGSIPQVVQDEIYTFTTRGTKDGRPIRTLGDYWRVLVNAPRWGVIGTSTRHVANIFDLLANADPGAVPDAVSNTVKLMSKRDPQAREDFLREATAMGLTAPFDEKRGWLSWSPFNKLTWDFDTAAAWSLGKRLLSTGKARSPLEAGQMAREMLVDYRHLSRLTKATQNIIPFAPFSTQFPGAVARGAGRNLGRTATMARAFPPAYGSTTNDQGQPRPLLYYGPTSETGAGLGDPGAFVRRRIGSSPVGAFASLGMRAFHVPPQFANYPTYGVDPLSLQYLGELGTGPIPYGRTVAGQMGAGPFKPLPPADEALRTMTGLMRSQPQDPQAKARKNALVGTFRGPISDLKKAGDDEGATLLDRVMQAKVKGDEATAQQLMAQFTKHRMDLLRQANPVPR